MSRISTLAIASALLGGAALMPPTTANAALFNWAGPSPTYTCPAGDAGCNTLTAGDDDINSLNLNGTNSLSFTAGGITATTAASTASGASVGTYYDIEGFASGRGGLGVRASGFGGETEQIDISTGDTLKVTLSAVQKITALTVFGPSHELWDGKININGVDFSVDDSVVLGLAGLASGTMFTFKTALDTSVDRDYYLSAMSTVPLPGAALLFGTALAGLGWMRRRRQAGTPETLTA